MERAEIIYASGPGPRIRHARNALELSGPEDCEREFSEWVPRERLVRVGMWHSHPNGGATPSRADLRAWRAGLELTGLDAYLGAIVTPSAHYGYRAGDVHVYVARHDGDGGVYVEPARVE